MCMRRSFGIMSPNNEYPRATSLRDACMGKWMLHNFGRRGQHLDRIRPSLAENGRSSANVGRTRPKSCPHRAKLGKTPCPSVKHALKSSLAMVVRAHLEHCCTGGPRFGVHFVWYLSNIVRTTHRGLDTHFLCVCEVSGYNRLAVSQPYACVIPLGCQKPGVTLLNEDPTPSAASKRRAAARWTARQPLPNRPTSTMQNGS